jgi:hypothetical protein
MAHVDGIKDLLTFLRLLRAQSVFFTLDQRRPDSIMVSITIAGARIEVDFFNDHIEYSVFRGAEDVLDDQPALFEMIRAFVEG